MSRRRPYRDPPPSRVPYDRRKDARLPGAPAIYTRPTLPPDPEVARFLKPQPPIPIPRPTFATAPIGLIAHSLLGRVITRHGE